MTSQEIWVIKWILLSLSTAGLVVGGVLTLRSIMADRRADDRMRRKFDALAKVLQSSPVLMHPSQLRTWLIERRGMFHGLSRWVTQTLVGGLLFGTLGGTAIWVLPLEFVIPGSYLIAISIPTAICLFSEKPLIRYANKHHSIYFFLFIGDGGLLFIAGIALWALLSVFVVSRTWAVDALSVATAFALCIAIAVTFRDILNNANRLIRNSDLTSPETDVRIGAFALGAAASVGLTIASLGLGRLANAAFSLQPTAQLILSNLLFDGLTLTLTIFLFQRFKLIISIALILILATLLGCLSLFIGVLGTNEQMSVVEVLRVFVARTPDGTDFFIGQPVWLVHTTFIPIVLFFLGLLLAIFGKWTVSILGAIAAKGAEPEPLRPYTVVIGMFGMLVIMFSVFATAAGFFEEIAAATERQNREPQSTTVTDGLIAAMNESTIAPSFPIHRSGFLAGWWRPCGDRAALPQIESTTIFSGQACGVWPHSVAGTAA